MGGEVRGAAGNGKAGRKAKPKWFWLAIGLGIALVLVLLMLFVLKNQTPSKDVVCQDTSGNARYVGVYTSAGNFCLELWPEKAPVTVRNFLDYIESGHYDGTVFHRVIPDFMVQGGGYDASLNEKPTGPAIRNEARNGIPNTTGTVAMARTQDPDSATAQFFINVKDNPFLDFNPESGNDGYAVFGKVSEGLEVVMAISKVPTETRNQAAGMPFENVPVDSVTIEHVQIEK